MKDFSIHESALAEIKCILNRYKRIGSVIVFVDEANPDTYMDKKAITAITEGEKSQDIEKIIRKTYDEIKDQLTYKLCVLVYDKKIVPPEELTEINGITVALNVKKLEILQNYCLTFENGRFLLCSGDKKLSNLQSLFNLRP